MSATTIRRTAADVREMRTAVSAGRDVTVHLSTVGMTTIRRGRRLCSCPDERNTCLRAALIAEGRTPWQADWQIRNT